MFRPTTIALVLVLLLGLFLTAWDFQKGSAARTHRAAEQGNAEAQTKLGNIYYFGQGVKKDYGKAIKWYRKAAEQGDDKAMLSVGYMYVHGYGVEHDDIEGVKWYRRAAERNNARAQHNMGDNYEAGMGLPQDSVQAYMWYILSLKGDLKGKELDHVLHERDSVSSKLTPEQKADAERLAAEWMPKR